MIIVGHSQGASHAAYLAQTKILPGAAFLSGPQDECQNCSPNTRFWIDEEFLTKEITAFAYGDEEGEPTLPIIEDNWKRMNVWSRPLRVINFLDNNGGYDVCKYPIVSTIPPSDTSLCTRRGHCSVAADQSTPYLNTTCGEIIPLYSLGVWTDLARVGQCDR